MSIDTVCPSCSRVLRVGDEHAGKQARCPVCNHMYTIPAAGGQALGTPPAGNVAAVGGSSGQAHPGPATSPAAARPESGSPQADTTQWCMKTPEGAMYGPVDRATLDRWYADGRIAADCHLAVGDSGSWRPAGEVFPQLASQTPQHPQPAGQHAAGQQQNPYESPRASTVGYQPMAGQAHLRPHRGGLILALGLLGLLSCQLLGVMAWLMGSEDLKEIRAGRMDPDGEGLTQAGTVLGIISSVILGLSLLAVLFVMFMMAAIAAAGG